MTNGEITLEDYKLTNIDLVTHYFTIRLKDEKEYIVYRKLLKTGELVYFIKKNDEEIPLSKKLIKVFLKEVKEYEREGI
jgi:hypothetical protein